MISTLLRAELPTRTGPISLQHFSMRSPNTKALSLVVKSLLASLLILKSLELLNVLSGVYGHRISHYLGSTILSILLILLSLRGHLTRRCWRRIRRPVWCGAYSRWSATASNYTT